MFYAESEKWERGLKKQIASSFGIKDLTVERENRAQELFELGFNSGQYSEKDRKTILNKIIGEDLRLATGEPDYNKIRDDVITQKTLETLVILQEDTETSARARRAQSQIKVINFIEPEDKEYLEKELSPDAFKKLIDSDYNMTEFNKTYTDIRAVDMSIIRNLQESLYVTSQTDLAITAGNSIEKQLRDLAGK